MYHFCTYFDQNYLLRGLTLYRSLSNTGCDFSLNVLALDIETHRAIESLGLPNLRSIALSTLEKWQPSLTRAKDNRSRIEYYFTLTPFLPLYVFDQHPGIELVTYLDADLCFYKSPALIFEELGSRSILICEHRYPKNLQNKTEYGLYNVQFQVFRRDDTGLTCLQRWGSQCLEWCYDRVEGDRYADQKYLNEWPSLYGKQIAVLSHLGAGVAPWNWATHSLELRDGSIFVGGQPLVFFHFHGVKIFNPYFISNGLADWGVMPYRERHWLYGGYIRQIRDTRHWFKERTGIDRPMKDNIIRGKGVNMSTLGEIARKAWVQAMIIY